MPVKVEPVLPRLRREYPVPRIKVVSGVLERYPNAVLLAGLCPRRLRPRSLRSLFKVFGISHGSQNYYLDNRAARLTGDATGFPKRKGSAWGLRRRRRFVQYLRDCEELDNAEWVLRGVPTGTDRELFTGGLQDPKTPFEDLCCAEFEQAVRDTEPSLSGDSAKERAMRVVVTCSDGRRWRDLEQTLGVSRVRLLQIRWAASSRLSRMLRWENREKEWGKTGARELLTLAVFLHVEKANAAELQSKGMKHDQ